MRLLSTQLLTQFDQQLRTDIVGYPVEHHSPLTALTTDHPEATDLLWTNPPLAVALANAATWDTLSGKWDRDFKRQLLQRRRRAVCGELGYPATESTVSILAKIEPAACNIGLLMRLRRTIRTPSLRTILSHVGRIGVAELTLAGLWEEFPHATVPLFAEMADFLAERGAMQQLALLRDCEELARDEGCALRRLRSMREVKRCHDRLVAKQIRREWNDPESDACEFRQLSFPPPPFPGTEMIQPIDSPAMLIEESSALHHCAAMYATRIAQGRAYFYRILAPERATLSIAPDQRGWHVDQLAGVCNQPISSATSNAVRSWLAAAQAGTAPLVC